MTDCRRLGTRPRLDEVRVEERRRRDGGQDHEAAGIGEGQVDAANIDRNPLDDMELVNRIVHRLLPLPFHPSISSACLSLPVPGPSGPGRPRRPCGAIPADRRTLRTPAANPRRRKTISPQGDVPSTLSIEHPTESDPHDHAADEFARQLQGFRNPSRTRRPLVFRTGPASAPLGQFGRKTTPSLVQSFRRGSLLRLPLPVRPARLPGFVPAHLGRLLSCGMASPAPAPKSGAT